MTTQTINQMETIYESATDTAKKIRAALKVSFPGVKFSVRSQSYSGGSNVNVSWVDMPLSSEVEKVVNQFKSGSFNGMEDIYESTGYIFEGKKYNGAKYLFCKRELSEEYTQQIKNWMKDNYHEINENSYEYYFHFNKAELMMIEEMNQVVETVVEVQETTLTIENVEVTNNNSLTVELIHNEKLHGLELKFNGKPSEATRELIKQNGFKWSKYNKVWYIKNSEKSLLFAESFVSAFNDTVAPEEVEQTEIIEEPTQAKIVEIEEILVKDSDLIDRKVFGQWGVMSGWDNGIITGETIYNEVIIKWKDNDFLNEVIEIKDLVFAHENTNMDAVGVYLLPIETNESEVVTETPVNVAETQVNTITPEQPKGKILDFNSRFKQKQEQQEKQSAFDYFTNEVLPFLTYEDKMKLFDAQDDKEKFNSIMLDLIIKAKGERLKQN